MASGSEQAMIFGALKLSVFLLAILGLCYGQSDDSTLDCSMHKTCDECIAGFLCVWCSDLPPFSGPRCTSKLENTDCLSPEDPVADPPDILENRPLEGDIQIAPQKLRVYLRTGEPQTFTLSVKPSRNYPLDMYFLMDLSGSQFADLEMLRNLSTSISAELQNISSDFTIGFGSFVDKIAYPYASTLQNGLDYKGTFLSFDEDKCASGRDQCEPTYVYRHQLSLNNEGSRFTDVLLNTTIQANLDSAEATLEALLQAITCLDDIGWRDDSLRMVMVITDAGFKTALDGKVGGLLLPNDGMCHLEWNEEGFHEYIRDPEQDFPSIHQVQQKLIENDIVTILAVTMAVLDLYTSLAEELGSSRSFVQEISDDSSDIVEVIRRAYESVTRDVVVENVPSLTIAITPEFNCKLTANGDGCADVTIEELVKFNLTVTMEECLDPSDIVISLPGFGTVDLELIPICDCNCSTEMEENHEACNFNGSLVCGTCDCARMFSGEQCECPHPLQSCENDCFNRGTCDRCTRVCTCDTRNDTGKIIGSYGEWCQCDNITSGACPDGLNGDTCSDRGECRCSSEQSCGCTCQCGTAPLSLRPYFPDDCSCDPDICHNVEFPDRQCANSVDKENDGDCECEGCVCPKGSVAFNKMCLDNSDLCDMYKSCAQCGLNCTEEEVEDCNPESLDESPGDAVQCQFERSGCTVDFEVSANRFEPIASVFVGEERDCPSTSEDLPWIIAVSVTLALLLLGALLLIIAKIVLIAIDRREYKKFLNEMNTGDFTPHSNPLYVTPQQEYDNPIKKRKQVSEDIDD